MKSENILATRTEVPTMPSAEIAALSIILQNYEALDAAKWDSDLFLNPTYQVILATAKEAHSSGHKPDLFRIQAILEQKNQIDSAGGYHSLTEVFTAYPCGDVATALDYRKDLMKARRYRRAMQKLHESKDDIREMTADLSNIAEHLADTEEETSKRKTIREQCLDLVTEMEQEQRPERFHSGIGGLDKLINGGFERGAVVVFASEPSGGKSIIMLQVGLQSAMNGKRGIIFSLEMPVCKVVARLVSCRSGWKVVSRYENPSQAHANAMRQGVMDVSQLPIQIFDNIHDIDEVESICRAEKKRGGGLDWIVLDYVQLCSPSNDGKTENREQQVSEVVRKLKLMALRLELCIFTASQLTDKGELRESRAIGHHADYVLHLDHSAHPDSEIRVSKNRNGERHVAAPVTMQGALSRFIDRNRRESR
jgi:replicative DNA helicase